MRTTIVVDDGNVESTTAPSQTAAPAAANAAPVDAGPAGGAGSRGLDAGSPPDWLIDAIAVAGGMRAPASPEGIELAGRDGGGAPLP